MDKPPLDLTPFWLSVRQGPDAVEPKYQAREFWRRVYEVHPPLPMPPDLEARLVRLWGRMDIEAIRARRKAAEVEGDQQ